MPTHKEVRDAKYIAKVARMGNSLRARRLRRKLGLVDAPGAPIEPTSVPEPVALKATKKKKRKTK